MRIPSHNLPHRGIALIIVMVVITFFSILVAAFSYRIKVETRLARNAAYNAEMDWLGRSGVELAKYVIGLQRTIPNEPYDSLNQKWAGGPGNSNSILANVRLNDIELGRGKFSVKITDCERKININLANELILNHVLAVIGVDPSETAGIAGSILDWIDPDDQTHLNGAENDYYRSLDPPYRAKNGPLDDINELLLVKGVTPELFWGPRYSGPPTITRRHSSRFGMEPEPITYSVGLVDVFTPLSARFVNINTASATVLQMCPGVDETIAQAIIEQRAGPDGMDGTEDDTPFRNVMELTRIPGLFGPGAAPPPAGGQPGRPAPPPANPLTSFFSTQSFTFEVEVDVRLDDQQRTYYAILRRVDQRNVQTLNIWWK